MSENQTKSKKTNVQDDKREAHLAQLFGLMRPGGRIDVDAYDELVNPFELKTTSKGSVSTARDLGYSHLDKWATRYWIVADFENQDVGFDFTGFWFLAPQHMKGWYTKIRRRLDDDGAVTQRALESMKRGGAPDADIERVAYLCHRGAKLNDPNITKGYIRENAIPLQPNKEHLRKLVLDYPLA